MEPVTENAIIIGDSRQLESFLLPDSVDLIITGPPYFNEVVYSQDAGQLSRIDDYASFLGEMNKVWKACAAVLKPGGIMAVWSHDFYRKDQSGTRRYVPFHLDLIKDLPSELSLKTISVWDRYLNERGKPVPSEGPLGTRLQYLALIQKNGTHQSNQKLIETSLAGHFWNPVWKEKTQPKLLNSKLLFRMVRALPSGVKKTLSPLGRKHIKDEHVFRNYLTECPPEIARRCLMEFSKPGDLVLDPFVGSGTSLMAALELGRRCIGVDINPKAAEAAVSKAGPGRFKILSPK